MYQIAFNDDLYEVLVPGLEMSSHGTGDIVFRASDQMKIVNKCDHCGRFGLEEIVFTTVEELVEAGWIRPVEKED